MKELENVLDLEALVNYLKEVKGYVEFNPKAFRNFGTIEEIQSIIDNLQQNDIEDIDNVVIEKALGLFDAKYFPFRFRGLSDDEFMEDYDFSFNDCKIFRYLENDYYNN